MITQDYLEGRQVLLLKVEMLEKLGTELATETPTSLKITENG